jgi:uncharacterized protein (TIGR02246 family)
MSRSDIEAVTVRFSQAAEKGDAAAMAALFTPDARVIPPGGPTLTGQGIQELWQSFLDGGVTGIAVKPVSLEELGDAAIEIGEYEIHAGPDVMDNGTYLTVHRPQSDGSWLMGVDIWNSDRPAPAQ